MKLPQFLDRVDKYTENMTHEQIESIIHEIARTLGEANRDKFLKTLEEYSKVSSPKERLKDKGKIELLLKIKDIIPKLKAIEEGEVSLDSEYNFEYSSWSDDEDEEYYFLDPEDLLYDVQEAISLVHKCIDMEMYKEGLKLVNTLYILDIRVTGDYEESINDTLELSDLYYHKLLFGNYVELQKEALYLTYMSTNIEDRAQELFSIFESFNSTSISLASILQMGNNQLPDFNLFLSSWIECLGEKTGKIATNLLKEALSMVNDDQTLLSCARKFYGEHPEIYLEILEKKDQCNNEEKLAIGLEAMARIPHYLTIRSSIALMTAYYAGVLNKLETRDKCWLEAFRSDTTVVNYMRIMLMTENPEKYKFEVSSIVHSIYGKSEDRKYRGISEEANLRKNEVSNKDYCVLLYFEELFDRMELIGMNTKETNGWSYSFKSDGFSLILLLIYKGNEYKEGMKKMIKNAIYTCGFSKEKLYKGTILSNSKSDEKVFIELFEKWKKGVVLRDEEIKLWMGKIEAWIKIRTKEIMEENKRDYYGSCTSFIAAYGEVLESIGEENGKERVMDSYRNEYKKRRLFIGELRNYGMKN